MPKLQDNVGLIEAKNLYKMKIATSLASLLDTTPFEKIRVCDVCRNAGVSRQTFYRHFGSKYEVVQWYWLSRSEVYLFRVGRDLNWHDSLYLNFESIGNMLDFFRIISKERGYESCVEFGARARIESLVETIKNYTCEPLTPKLQLQIDFFACAEARIVGREVLQKPSIDPAWLAEVLESCVPRDLHDLLDIPSS